MLGHLLKNIKKKKEGSSHLVFDDISAKNCNKSDSLNKTFWDILFAFQFAILVYIYVYI